MKVTFDNTHIYLASGALSISPNAHGEPRLMTVGTAPGAAVKVFYSGIPDLNYAADTVSYRVYPLSASDTAFAAAGKTCYVYMRLELDNTALLIFSSSDPETEKALVSDHQDGKCLMNIGGTDRSWTPAKDSSGRWWVYLGVMHFESNRYTEPELDFGNLGSDRGLRADELGGGAIAFDQQQKLIKLGGGWKFDVLTAIKGVFTESISVGDRLFSYILHGTETHPDGQGGTVSVEGDAAPMTETVNEANGKIVSKGWLHNKFVPWFRDNISTLFGDKFLSKEHDDETKHQLGVGKLAVAPVGEGRIPDSTLATFGKAVDSMLNGQGTLVATNGRMQLDNLEVRKSMTVMELVINQLHAMDGDYYFGDAAVIERVEPDRDNGLRESYGSDAGKPSLGDGSPVYTFFSQYWLYFRKDTEKVGKDMASYKWRKGDIILSIISNLGESGAGNPVYSQSWMRCEETDPDNNRIRVYMISDSDCGTTNTPPQEGFVCVRRGNYDATNYGPGTAENRQSAWHLSAREGNMVYFDDLDRPVQGVENYKLVLGKFPEIGPMRDHKGKVGLYAQTILYSQLQQVQWAGRVRREYTDHGEWNIVDAGEGAYRYHRHVNDDNWTIISQSRVFHRGFQWACIGVDPGKDHATGEPKWNSDQWIVIGGGTADAYSIDIRSSHGDSFYLDSVDTVLTGHLLFNGQDVTDDALQSGLVKWKWTRESGSSLADLSADNEWNTKWPDKQQADIASGKCKTNNQLHVTNDDMGLTWQNELYCTFRLQATITVAGNLYTAQAELEFGV